MNGTQECFRLDAGNYSKYLFLPGPYEIYRWTLVNKLFRLQIRKKFRNWKEKVARNPGSNWAGSSKKT